MSVYSVNINKKFRNVRVFTIKKKIKGNANAASKFVESLIQKYITKEKNEA